MVPSVAFISTVQYRLCVNLVVSALCYGISFGTSIVDTVYQLSSLFTILVHIRCQVCFYGPRILCSLPIFLPVHALQSPDAICTLDVLLLFPGPCRAHLNVSVISSLPGMPRVQCAMSSLGTGLPFFAVPHFIPRCHVCSIALIFQARIFRFLQRLTVRMLGSALTLSTVR